MAGHGLSVDTRSPSEVAGITAFVPSSETDVTRHLEAADVALYSAKRGGGNKVVRAAGVAAAL